MFSMFPQNKMKHYQSTIPINKIYTSHIYMGENIKLQFHSKSKCVINVIYERNSVCRI